MDGTIREPPDMLHIEIAKRPDGVGVLRCTRADGSVSWQKQVRHSAHFALHDLTHYAVETALGYRRGFFGLIAEGWEIEDTTGKGSRGALPEEALEAEKIVGLFDSERNSGQLLTLAGFNQFAPRPLRQAEIDSVRALRGELFARWSQTALGETMKLSFEPGSTSNRAPACHSERGA